MSNKRSSGNSHNESATPHSRPMAKPKATGNQGGGSGNGNQGGAASGTSQGDGSSQTGGGNGADASSQARNG
jgi:hypothetical protein